MKINSGCIFCQDEQSFLVWFELLVGFRGVEFSKNRLEFSLHIIEGLEELLLSTIPFFTLHPMSIPLAVPRNQVQIAQSHAVQLWSHTRLLLSALERPTSAGPAALTRVQPCSGLALSPEVCAAMST